MISWFQISNDLIHTTSKGRVVRIFLPFFSYFFLDPDIIDVGIMDTYASQF
jgi:hypothetical protein